MSWNPSHDWTPGAALPELSAGAVVTGGKLSTCSLCGTLRVEEAGRVSFIRRAPGEGRVVEVEPPCVTQARFIRAPW
ncbi:MAG: hypothetical protein JWL95_3250 [Gemmatimonadetes bacterium]|nr:hypothetical protein [Gemmatimonadota bacterium]